MILFLSFGFYVELFLFSLVLMSFNPLLMILIFVVYLILVVFSLVFLLNTYYYSYLVYLLFVSGLMVMFMYICSIVFNEKIYLDFNFYVFFGCVGLNLFFSSDFSWMGLLGISGFVVYFEFYNLLKFFIFSFSFFSLFFLFYLFFCLIVVYEVIKKNEGPLRMSI